MTRSREQIFKGRKKNNIASNQIGFSRNERKIEKEQYFVFTRNPVKIDPVPFNHRDEH